MNDEQQAKLKAAHEERTAILGRIEQRFGNMKIDDPPSFSPFLGQRSGQQLLEASRAYCEGLEGEADLEAELAAVREAVEAALAPGEDFDERSTPVVVVSLAGLRRIDALLSELEQRREGDPDGQGAASA